MFITAGLSSQPINTTRERKWSRNLHKFTLINVQASQDSEHFPLIIWIWCLISSFKLKNNSSSLFCTNSSLTKDTLKKKNTVQYGVLSCAAFYSEVFLWCSLTLLIEVGWLSVWCSIIGTSSILKHLHDGFITGLSDQTRVDKLVWRHKVTHQTRSRTTLYFCSSSEARVSTVGAVRQ